MPYGAIVAAFNGARVTACCALVLLLSIALPSTTHAQTLPIAVLGDSITAGYDLPPREALPVKLETALKATGRDIAVVNHGVSGESEYPTTLVIDRR